MAVLHKSKPLGDVFKSVFHPAYNYEGANILNDTGADLEKVDVCAQPVKKSGADWVFVLAGDEANVEGLLHSQELLTLADNEVTTKPRAAMTRGPAIVNKDGFPDNDVAGDALDKDALALALAALDVPIVSVVDPSQTTTQTT